MGKASSLRKTRRKNFLAKLSSKKLDEFEAAWMMQLESWLSEIRHLAKEWVRGCEEARKKIFGILDETMALFKECEKSVYRQYSKPTYEKLSHECCRQVSRVIDKRLNRLSNMDQLIYKARKSSGYHQLRRGGKRDARSFH